jgi:hypothetical protein
MTVERARKGASLCLLICLVAMLRPGAGLAQLPTTRAAATPAVNASASSAGQPSQQAFFAPPTAASRLEAASPLIPDDARALVLVDARLHAQIAPALHDYLGAAAKRRHFRIVLLPLSNLDDCPPDQVRAALRDWHATRPGIEGVLFVGNVKLPSFFMPRPDIHSVRLWPRFFEDLEMTPTRKIAPGTVLTNDAGGAPGWPRIAGVKSLTVGPHGYDFFTEGKSPGPALWTAYLPVGFQEDARNTYPQWAAQLAAFFEKAKAFHKGTTIYGRGLYLVSNDLGLMTRSKPVWEAVGPKEIEFFAINEKGPGAFKDNAAGYQRALLEKYASLEEFTAYAKTLPWMDEGWQNADLFLKQMAQARRRIVWWNVHSNPEWSMISWQQARGLREGGLIALLNGCSVGGFRQPGSPSKVDTKTTPERNILASLVYGQSAFVAALGSTHDRVTDERATPLLRHLYSGGYLGMAHLLRSRQADEDVKRNPMQLREFQEMLIGDPFVDGR